jgi:hypothetical protein
MGGGTGFTNKMLLFLAFLSATLPRHFYSSGSRLLTTVTWYCTKKWGHRYNGTLEKEHQSSMYRLDFNHKDDFRSRYRNLGPSISTSTPDTYIVGPQNPGFMPQLTDSYGTRNVWNTYHDCLHQRYAREAKMSDLTFSSISNSGCTQITGCLIPNVLVWNVLHWPSAAITPSRVRDSAK